LAPLGVGAVIGASVVPAVVATALFALLRRRSKRPLLVFSCMAVAVLLVSMLPVGTIAVDRPATRLVLGLMHVLDATVIVAIIAFISRPTRTKDARDLGRIVATTLLGLMYLPPSISKVLGTGKIADNFRAWGYPDWTIYMTGAIQLLGVVLLATRRSAPAGALLLAASAIESAFVNGTHGAGAMIAFPFLQLVFALAVAWLNRPRKQATELDLQSTP
jgi:uncharacterized membrane-anchored protein